MPSILGDLESDRVSYQPFAHLVADGVVDAALYQELERDFPSSQRFVRGLPKVAGNQAIRIPARDLVDNPEFSPAWRDFIRYHSSQAFWNDIVRVMGEALRRSYPDLERRAGKRLEDWVAKRRGTNDRGDVELDAQLVVNTPVHKQSSVRPAHVDSEDEIFAGLLYMRAAGDDTEGGDLALYHFVARPQFSGHYARLGDLALDRTVSYAANRLVAFVNSQQSIHGVTPRPRTDRYRRYVNFIASTPFAAFSLPRMSPINHLICSLKRRHGKARGIRALIG
jgi:hypothetical protein